MSAHNSDRLSYNPGMSERRSWGGVVVKIGGAALAIAIAAGVGHLAGELQDAIGNMFNQSQETSQGDPDNE